MNKRAVQHIHVLFSGDGTLLGARVARFPPRLLRWAKRLSPRITEAYQYTLNHVLTCQLAAATLLADALAIQKWKVNVGARVCHPFAGEFQNKVAVPEPKKRTKKKNKELSFIFAHS